MQQNPDTLGFPIPSGRIRSVDLLRGIIMVIMALDHTRDYFSGFHGDPLDVDHASTIMFFTRWITHFCAPVFIFLAGTSSFLSMSRGKTIGKASQMLLTRGLFLVFLELTIVRFGWAFNMDYHTIFVQVIWAIGWSMVFLSVLIFLPRFAILAIGLLLVFGHNAFDGIQDNVVALPWLWDIVHQQHAFFIGPVRLFILYPLVPWIGVMACGYCFGAVLLKPEKQRNKWLYGIGLGSILLFIIIRALNIYGDMHQWQVQATLVETVEDFVKCTKYPPSLLYLLMTLGPAISLMPMLEKAGGRVASFFTVYGRVPMFYYILHIYLIHTSAFIIGIGMGYPSDIFTKNGFMFDPKLVWGFSLGWVYFFWASVVLLLYYPCRWYMNQKLKYKKWWMSYL